MSLNYAFIDEFIRTTFNKIILLLTHEIYLIKRSEYIRYLIKTFHIVLLAIIHFTKND